MKLNGVDITVRYIEHSNAFIPEPEISPKSKFWIHENPPNQSMTYEEAKNYVKSLGKDWRLPTIEDLQIIFETRLRTKFQSKPYWTDKDNFDTVTTVGFLTGVTFEHNKLNKFMVMPVRGDIRRFELVAVKESKAQRILD